MTKPINSIFGREDMRVRVRDYVEANVEGRAFLYALCGDVELFERLFLKMEPSDSLRPLTKEQHLFYDALFESYEGMEDLHIYRTTCTGYQGKWIYKWYAEFAEKTCRIHYSLSAFEIYLNQCIETGDEEFNGRSIRQSLVHLYRWMFGIALGLDLKHPQNTARACNDAVQKGLFSIHDAPIDKEMRRVLGKFAARIDAQNGDGAFAAALLYPLFNTDPQLDAQRICVLGFEANSGKTLFTRFVQKLYKQCSFFSLKGFPDQKIGAKRDRYLNYAMKHSDISIIVGSDQKYELKARIEDLYQNHNKSKLDLLETPSLNIYVDTHHNNILLRGLPERVFWLQMCEDVDAYLTKEEILALVDIKGNVLREYALTHWEKAKVYWTTYELPEAFHDKKYNRFDERRYLK